ncbi:MAG: hypothetical protein MJ248_01540 [Bacilli bacterium]|nr:hypothetical protein [Bacilli bacterium]
MKTRLSTLINKWPLYLIGVASVSIIVCTGVSIKCSPKENESIYVFAPTYSFNVSRFVDESLKVTDGIRQITVKHADPNTEEAIRTFGSYYSICDLYIMPSSWVERISPIAASFSDEQIKTLLPNVDGYDFYKEEDKNLGIKIYEKNTNTGVGKDIITYTSEKEENEDYYLLFRNDSIHIGSLNNSQSDNALRIVNNLLKL